MINSLSKSQKGKHENSGYTKLNHAKPHKNQCFLPPDTLHLCILEGKKYQKIWSPLSP